MNSPIVKLSREDLYRLIWETPASVLAAQYDISDVGLAKACKRMGIPRPPRGYWQRKEAGKPVATVPLPPARPTDQRSVEFRLATHPRLPESPRRDPIAAEVFQSFDQPHRLVELTLRRFEKASVNKNGLLDPAATRRLHLTVSRDQLDRALRLYDAILKAWEQAGNEVLLGEEDTLPTLLRSGNETLRISIEEEVETVSLPPTEAELLKPRWHWKERTETRGKGTLRILLSGDQVEEWRPFQRRFHARPTSTLERTAGRILTTAMSYLEDRRAYLVVAEQRRKEREEQSRIEAERRRREEEARRRQEAEKKRVEDFLDAAKDWEKARRLREFIAECRTRMAATGIDEVAIGEWVAWAETIADDHDPFVGGYLEGSLQNR